MTGTRSVATGKSDLDLMRQVVQLACRAPSVHNTQPWRWRIDGPHLELRADHDRQLQVSDPEGRNLIISCGAALHHLAVASIGLGRDLVVTRFPDADDPDLLAVARLGHQVPVSPAAALLLQALERRVTDRRRFTSWPVPEQRLDELATDDDRWGTRIIALHGAASRHTLERLVDRARQVQAGDPRYADEQRQWTGRTSSDGLPPASLPPQEHTRERRDRFDRMIQPDEAATVLGRAPGLATTDGVLAICTARDDVPAWLGAGEALSALWLRATVGELSLVPLSQVIEVEETRRHLFDQLFFAMARPQLLVRIGWQELGRRPMPPTPRRALADVLEP